MPSKVLAMTASFERNGRLPWTVAAQMTAHLLVVIVLVLSSSVPLVIASTSGGGGGQRKNVSPTTKRVEPSAGGGLGSGNHAEISPSDTCDAEKLPESIEAARQNWRRAFEEIKSLKLVSPPIGTNRLLNQWKLLLDGSSSGIAGKDVGRPAGDGASPNGETRPGGDDKTGEEEGGAAPRPNKARAMRRQPRFDGFQTWDRRLQQWADDAAEYLAQNQILKDQPGGYPLSSFGVPLSTNVTTETEKEAVKEGEEMVSAATAPTGTLPLLTLSTEKLQLMPEPKPVTAGEPVLPHTDLSDKSKNVWIVTTAALPWMTGTAVNPLLRAAYMSTGRGSAGGSVTLMLPWVERRSDQERVYGKDRIFDSPEDQEAYIRGWLRETADMEEASNDLRIRWYTAWQERAENSLYSMGDITALIPEEDCDICVLEEPEHLNWYRAPGESWTQKFKHVVGIVHTNYFVYAQEQPAALIRAPAMRLLCSWMCRAHCHRVIKLSGTLGKFSPEKELVENVHGVRRTFLDAGDGVRKTLLSASGISDPVFGPDATPTVYFIGKMLWSKGLGSLMELVEYAEESAGLKVKVDMYGGGPDKDEAIAKSKKLGLDMPFHGPLDHAELASTHKIFVNPSTSEVLCTTVAEALAMGKFVVLPSHPSNDFFAQFPNCLPYSNKEEFVGNLYYAFTHSPEPLSDEYSYALSWEAATKRFEAAGSVSVAEAEAMEHALASSEAGVEINLPPLFENEERRKRIATSFRQSRSRFRQFRSRLSQEIQQSNVLPKDLQQRLVADLDKRLDLDLDAMLESPKLRLKLSPAELDKQLLEFYNSVSQGSSGDVLRVIGGGANVGLQNLYLKRQARKLGKAGESQRGDSIPLFLEDDDLAAEEVGTATAWVKRALRRNFPRKSQSFVPLNALKKSGRGDGQINQRDGPKMTLGNVYPRARYPISGRKSWEMSLQCRPIRCSLPPYRCTYVRCAPLI